jgi:methylated-DNA-[protein]-cysteine S-methyltransferase
MKFIYTYYLSPIGPLLLESDGEALVGVSFLGVGGERRRPALGSIEAGAHFRGVIEQFAAYFGGGLRAFNLLVRPEGTEFQRRAWAELGRIPYGETISYAEQARRIGVPRGARAVGAANGRNPLPLVIPCHRVIGASGSLVGFGGGLARKEWLLRHERDWAGPAAAGSRRGRAARAAAAGPVASRS